MSRAQYLMLGSRVGLSARETMLMKPGIVFDMLEISGIKKEDDADAIEDDID